MANQSNSRPVKRSGGINATFLGAVILGICILIAGLNISGSIRKLNKTVTETQFAATNTLNVPSEMAVGNNNYMTESEAGEYLNLSTEKIIDLIAKGAPGIHLYIMNNADIAKQIYARLERVFNELF